MRYRIRKLRHKIRRRKGLDILISHAPAFGINDGEDLPHRGFRCFLHLLDRHQPKYFVHGHMHLSKNPSLKRITKYHDTTVINACGRYVLEYTVGR